MLRLFRRARVLVRGRLSLAAADTHCDILQMDWNRVAAKVAKDLAAGKTPKHAVCFQAHWRPQVDARQFAPIE